MPGWPFTSDPTPVLRNGDLLLRAARGSDYVAWQALRRQSRDFLKPFEPRWGEADLKKSIYQLRLRKTREAAVLGAEFSFFIFIHEGKEEILVGGLTISNIRRRAAQMASLGYWMGSEFAGNGIMTRAVGLVVPAAFNNLGLHRLQAACLPHNTASRAVLEKNRFKEEGYAENYLQIDGAWQDHVLYAISRERFEGLRG
jgi:ribosomal-protein-alanine N-acetyltransferase